MKFFMAMKPPTVTHQEKQVRVVNGKPVFYEPAELKNARAKLRANLASQKPLSPYDKPLELVSNLVLPAGKTPGWRIPGHQTGYRQPAEASEGLHDRCGILEG